MSTFQTPTPQQVNATPQHEIITGVIERLTFHSEESGYTVARLVRPRFRDLTTIVGSFANIQPGQTLQLTGFWREHPQFGPQFQVTNYKETKPATLTGIEKYLGSGLIKGVGPVTAKRIVAHFGLETLDIIENQIERLIEVQGIAKKRITLIIIQLTNDYNREVFNGDLGNILSIDTVEQEVTVDYGGRAVVYDYADLNEITLAFAVSVHKSQGSEYPVVIFPLYMQHYMMLSRNLFYTGLTRARKLAIIIGDKKAISLAVRTTDDQQRYTRLWQRLLQPI
jgi:ATP-dependent exoDNAse (exonuclease V) alpha subunit